MKIWHIVLVGFLFCCGAVNAQIYQPVENNFEDVDADIDTDAEESAVEVKEEKISKNKNEAEEVHFATRQKDLAIAKAWLQQEFSHNGGKNIVVSPVAFYLASVVVANGVVDESLLEFSNLFSVLKLSEVGQNINSYLYREKDNVFINLSLWGKAFSERYQKMMSEQFGTEIWGIKESTSSINGWAEKRTKGVIKEIAPVKNAAEGELYVGSISYFKGQLPLMTYSVKEEDFNGKKGKVSMLSAQVEADYYEDDEKQAIRLFCGNGNTLTILLPKKGVDFVEFVGGLDIYNLIPEFDENEKINVNIPVFNFDYNAVFTKNVYDILNIRQIFMKENYGFAKMVSFDEDVFLKDLFMTSKIDISGYGAVSEGETENTAAKHTFNANRPFVFIINNGDFIGTFVHGD